METFPFGVTGDKTLATVNQIISQREKNHCEFTESKIVYEDGVVLNQVTLKLYDDASVPKKLTLARKGSPAPANAEKFWEGIVAVENNLMVVTGYRDK